MTGLRDAVGEPVGTRFGRHTYKVPSLRSVAATRSWEGSGAVVIMSAIAIALGLLLTPRIDMTPWHLVSVPVLALVCGVVEAASPHGWDNMTMQIVPTWIAATML